MGHLVILRVLKATGILAPNFVIVCRMHIGQGYLLNVKVSMQFLMNKN